MKKRMLLTSFDIWLPNQMSNSSDDLLIEVAKLEELPCNLTFLRHLPVNVLFASSRVITKINQVQFDYIICCGMAASRTQLSVEDNASSISILSVDSFSNSTGILCVDILPESVLQTTVDLKQLVAATSAIEISYDCGKFVCEGLYYSVLDYLRVHQPSVGCIFVHVPVLNQANLAGILQDFLLVIRSLALS